MERDQKEAQADFRYWAFLSYAHADRATAKWLHRALENYAIPGRLVGRQTSMGPAPRRVRPIFRDTAELPADIDLRARIEAALVQSRWLIVLCSPKAAASRWVQREIERFLEVRSQSRILTVLSADTPQVGHEVSLPSPLRYGLSEALAALPEPLCADLRRGRDGRHLAKLKIVAGLLEVGLDELVARDSRRRMRRAVALTTASVAGACIMGALTMRAVLAQRQADRHRAEAEQLIGYMLGDLRKRLDATNRLDLMDSIGRQALAYYAAQQTTELDSDALGRRSRALHLIGEVNVQRGQLDQALRAFEQAETTTGELLSRSPADANRIFDHAQSVFWVGNVADRRGRFAEAESRFQTYRRLAERLVSIDGLNDDWQAEADDAYSVLGTLYLEEGRTREAVDAFSRSLEVSRRLWRRRPDSMDRTLDLGQSHAWLADAYEQQGRFAWARSQRKAELALYTALLQADPTAEKASFSTIPALRAIARQDLMSGNLRAAVAGFARATSLAESLFTSRPDNMDLAAEAAVAHLDSGDALLFAGQGSRALVQQNRAATLIRSLLAQDDTVKEWKRYLDRSRLLMGGIAASKQQSLKALRWNELARTDLDGNQLTDPSADARWLRNRARLQTAANLATLGRSGAARAEWSLIVAELPDPVGHYDPKLLLICREADLRLGNVSDARAIGAYLRRIGVATTGWITHLD